MLFNIFTYLVIPGFTVLFAKGYGWFTTNFSVIGNYFDKKAAFVLWGILVGVYFYITLNGIIKNMPRRPGFAFLIPLALVLLAFAVTTPYLPDILPLKSFLHIIFAFLASVLLLLFLALATWKLYQASPDAYRMCLASVAGIAAGSAFLFSLTGIISSALELFFILTTVFLSHRLLTLSRAAALKLTCQQPQA